MTRLSLQERAARQGLIRADPPAAVGSPATLALWAKDKAAVSVVPAALTLAATGLTTLQAKRTVESVLDRPVKTVLLPKVADKAALIEDLRRYGIDARDRSIPDAIDVRQVRERLHMTQGDFALQFGFEVRTLQNWEQNKAVPDAAVRAYLRVIEHVPTVVGQVLCRPQAEEQAMRKIYMMHFYRQTPGDCRVPVMATVEETVPEAGVALADTLLAYFSDTKTDPADRPHTACLMDADGSVPIELTVRSGTTIEITRGRRPDHAISRVLEL